MAYTELIKAQSDGAGKGRIGEPTYTADNYFQLPAVGGASSGAALPLMAATSTLTSTCVPYADANGNLTCNAAFFFTAATLAMTANSIAQTVQSVAVSTTPTVNLALGNTVVIGASGVPGALTAATTITFQNPTIGSTTTLMFKQFTTSVAVTFTLAGYTFYQNGKTAGVASGSPVLLAADMTLSCYYTVHITWTSATTAIVILCKS